jgi:hypothetical protein
MEFKVKHLLMFVISFLQTCHSHSHMMSDVESSSMLLDLTEFEDFELFTTMTTLFIIEESSVQSSTGCILY